ncbi:unnamed protein product [Rotaria sp. Silwood2]|nr:unnamed protein product [Rotaria sp. Silwood2]CAF4313192.1 unnamed protein product [Rotaria sp. Silwood2]
MNEDPTLSLLIRKKVFSRLISYTEVNILLRVKNHDADRHCLTLNVQVSIMSSYNNGANDSEFKELGYEPNAIVSCLPIDVELDGRLNSVRSSTTLLTAEICESMLKLTAYNQTIIAIINGGTVRIDDILRETIIQYDIIRTLPFGNRVIALSVPGHLLAQVLTKGTSLKGNGIFIAYTRVETFDGGNTWLLNGTDISKSGLYYDVATTAYIRDFTQLNKSYVITLHNANVTQTKSLMQYLTIKYSPC